MVSIDGMTNGGIIEGQMGINPCSDLSPSTLFLAGAGWVFSGHDAHARVVDVAQRLPSDLFGSGETRMKMRNQRWFGGIVAGVPPRSR